LVGRARTLPFLFSSDTRMTARTICHIHSRLIGVRIPESGHCADEEALVCPLVRDEIDDAGQLP
jgi:hypothetical protein